jgi:hypothetical protein
MRFGVSPRPIAEPLKISQLPLGNFPTGWVNFPDRGFLFSPGNPPDPPDEHGQPSTTLAILPKQTKATLFHASGETDFTALGL